MYLKQLDVIGFKSFADKTRLTFEPGMIAIVGPNGCGKSNVSDAIRWVLGEQRPTALRCTKMSDVLFNGTDTRKPLGMAEVSITFAECEALLGTEYHEVTVTRRVYRDGSGEYFINKTASRLKDVQRLFMGTGIGTTSYSVMAQGQIDQILSSKPEDRRAVFEEAAGITKFKADRKEALRKIDQTEQNLLREADVLREMKRQIGSLQRQVGKAKRYKELRDELRGLDVYLSKGRIQALDLALENNVRQQRETEAAIAAAIEQVGAAEAESQRLHGEIHELEEKLAVLATEAAAADGAYARAREMIAVNESRISEYRAFSERDGREIAETRRLLEEVGLQIESLEQKQALLENGAEVAQEEVDAAEKAFAESTAKIDALRQNVQMERTESFRADRRAAEARDQIAQLEAQARAVLLKKERLAAEEAQVRVNRETAEATLADVRQRLDAAKQAEAEEQAKAAEAEAARAELAAELDDLRANFGKMQAEAAAKEAQLALLGDAADRAGEFSAGAQALLDGALGLPPGVVLGSLADRFDAPADLRVALEAALRSWLDAVVVADADAARAAMKALYAGESGSARLVALGGKRAAASVPAAPAGATRLLDAVTTADDFKDAAETLLGNVFLVADRDALFAAWAACVEAGGGDVRLVSKDGAVVSAAGFEAWIPGAAAASPLSRKMLISETTTALEALKQRLDQGRTTLETGAERGAALAEQAQNAARALDAARRAAAQAEGEFASVERDVVALAERHEDVSARLAEAVAEDAEDGGRRDALAQELEAALARRDELMERIAVEQDELQSREAAGAQESRQLTEKRIAAAQMQNELQLTGQQRADAERRRDELGRSIGGREEGIKGYEESIRRLTEETAELMGSLDDLQEKAADVRRRVDGERQRRTELQNALGAAEAGVGAKREALDRARDVKGRLEVAATEATMRRQNVYDHLNQEYGLDPNGAKLEPDPQWKGKEPPPQEELEARVNALNGEIAALGPVNMVAIDEFRELEERYAKEKAQEADLLAAKERIRALIQDLNGKSGELFRTTFEQANANFQKTFTKLFNGGEARLVLLENDEDPLECGIDIIARPPGKRPQSVTLLSGGERTMTAVALLFAIFRIKPAPFTMLDELDAALDDANIGRFVDALKEFLDRSQFLIITHNQHTIAGSDLVYGVSQQEKGISRIISMRLSDVGLETDRDV